MASRFRDLAVAWKVTAVGTVGLLTALAVGGFGWRCLGREEEDLAAVVHEVAKPAMTMGDMREVYARGRSRSS